MNKMALGAFTALLLSGCSSVPLSGEAYDAVAAGSLSGYKPVSNYELGKRNLSAHNYGNAITAFLRDLERDPNSIATLNGLAIAYHEIGREDLAKDFWDRALSVDPDSEITLNNLAYLNLKRGDNETALAYATRAQTQAAAAKDAGAQPSIVSVISNNIAAASGQPLQNLSAPNEVVLSSTEQPQPVNGVERIDEKEWQLRTTAADAPPTETVRIAVPVPSDLPTIVTNPTGAARIEAPETAPQARLAAIAPAQASSLAVAEPQISLAQAPAEELKLRPVEKPSDVQAVESASAIEDDPTRPGATLAELTSDPTVVMQRLPSDEPGLALPEATSADMQVASFSPDVASDEPANNTSGEEISVAVAAPAVAPNVVPTAKPIAEVQANALAPAPTLEELASDPTVVMQRLPSEEPSAIQSASSNAAGQEWSIPSDTALDAPTNEPATEDTSIAESLPALEPSIEPEAEPGFAVQANALAPSRTLSELASDPTVMIQRLPLYEPEHVLSAEPEVQHQTGDLSAVVTFEQPATEEQGTLQSITSVETGAAPESQPPLTPRTDTTTAAVTLEELSNDPTVVIQRLPSADTGVLPSIVTNTGTQKNLSRPALRPEISAETQSETAVLRYAATVQALIDDPAIVVQRIPGFEPQLRGSIPSDTASETNGEAPAVSSDASVGEPTASLQSEGASNLYVQSSFLPVADRFRLRISNGAGSEDLANRFATFISERGFVPDYVRNASSFDYEQSYVFYNPGLLATAQKIAEMIPVPVKLVEASQGSGGVEVILGSDLIGFDARL